MDTFLKTLSLLLLAVRPTSSEYFIKEECHKLDMCRTRYPFDDPSGEKAPSTGNYSDVIDWDAAAVMAPRDMNNTQFLKSMCQCDEDCGLYGDCCRDASEVYTHNSEQIDSNQHAWSCQPLWKTTAKNDWKVAIYMIARCPLRWPDSFDYDGYLMAMCERVGIASSDYSHLMDIPVLSLKTNVTYANIFCARCNGDSDQLASWNFTYKCDQNVPRLNVSMQDIIDTTNYIPGSRKWVHRGRNVNIVCDLVIEQFKNVTDYAKNTNARRCIPNIGQCPTEWTHTNDSLQCDSYTSYVIDPVTNQVYKNPHCATCNNVTRNETDYLCARFASPHSGGMARGRFSFSGVFDFTFGWHVSSVGDDRVGLEKRCSANEIFDHLYHRCHSIVCGAMYDNHEGVCVPKRWTIREQSLEALLNSSCPRLNLKRGVDYFRLDNGSVVLNKTGCLLRPGEYEITPNETDSIQICYDESMQDYYFKYSAFQRHLSDFCLSVSVLCLVIHIAIHCAIPKLRNLPGKNLLSLSCSLLLAQLLFLVAIDARESIGHGVCAGVGVLSHWSYLSAFFWMNIMGVDVSRTFVGAQILVRHNSNGRGQRSAYRLYSLYAWGCPTLVVSAGLLVDAAHLSEHYAPNYGEHLCWICNKRGLAVFFVLPVAALLFANCILFALTVVSIKRQRNAAKFAVQTNQTYRKTAVAADGECNQSTGGTSPVLAQHQRSADAKHKHQQQIRFVIYFKLALIMGLGWVSGFVAALTDWQILWYPFIVFNALQGAFIFVTFDCKLKIYYMLYQWMMKRPHPLDRTSSATNPQTRTTKTSTTSQPIAVASQLLDHDDQTTRTE